jgi:hypothetical protein
LPQPEPAMLESHASTFPCLLYSCRTATYGTTLWRLLGIDQ